jgi:hypothetical protein
VEEANIGCASGRVHFFNPSNTMPVNPVFLAAREQEQRNRMLTYLPWPVPLRLKTKPPKGFGPNLRRRVGLWPSSVLFPICHFTERHLMELNLISNAFMSGSPAIFGDIQQFLWRLSPWFMRPDGELANRRTPGQQKVFATFGQRFCALREQRRIARTVPTLHLFAAELAISGYLAMTIQDAPSAGGDDKASKSGARRGMACPPFNAYDSLTRFCTDDLNLEASAFLDYPRAMIFQLYRARLLSEPDGILLVSDPSDRLLDLEQAEREREKYLPAK